MRKKADGGKRKRKSAKPHSKEKRNRRAKHVTTKGVIKVSSHSHNPSRIRVDSEKKKKIKPTMNTQQGKAYEKWSLSQDQTKKTEAAEIGKDSSRTENDTMATGTTTWKKYMIMEISIISQGRNLEKGTETNVSKNATGTKSDEWRKGSGKKKNNRKPTTPPEKNSQKSTRGIPK